LKEVIEKINHNIRHWAKKANRDPETIRLVAVSKTVSAQRVEEAIIAGATLFGENYIQEAKIKYDTLSSYDVKWHFIGHLQTNKAKYATAIFDLIHCVDSLKLAKALNKEAGKINKIQNILVQVNISKEDSKSGVSEEKTIDLIKNISKLTNLSVNGLMTMPPFFDNPEKARPYFKALKELGDFIKKQAIPNVYMNELSMGMSGDFQVAIEEGATMVRIGTAIFGARY